MSLFETDRLVVRRLVAGDEEAMAAIYGDPETVRFVGDAEPLDVETCRHWIDVTDGNFIVRGYGMVALVEKSSGEMIGCTGIVHPGQQAEAEVKYAFRRDRWGMGFATEAVGGLLAYARSAWGVGPVIATTHPGNDASHRVLRKVGFVHALDRVNEDGSVTGVWETAD